MMPTTPTKPKNSSKPPTPSKPPAPLDPALFALSHAIHDRSSTFIALYSPSLPVASLVAYPPFEEASHRIRATRLPSRQTTLIPSAHRYDTTHADDGERDGGRRLSKVLESEGATGSIVVARWYGGEMLGVKRWEHLENCAKEAIARYRQGERGQIMSQTANPRKRAAQESMTSPNKVHKVNMQMLSPQGTKTKMRALITELCTRDANIEELRDLLREKKAQLADVPSPAVPSPAKKVHYEAMDLAALERCELARDRTIKLLLDQLDKVDKLLQEEAGLDAAVEAVGNKVEKDKAMDAAAWEEMESLMKSGKASSLSEKPTPRTPSPSRRMIDDAALAEMAKDSQDDDF